MSKNAVHQAIDTLAPGSAVSNCLQVAQETLRQAGYLANVRARSVQPGTSLQNRWRPLQRYSKALWLYHFSVGSSMTRWAAKQAGRTDIVLWYHNLTPLFYFQASDPLLAGRLAAGRKELQLLADVCVGAIADSEFNAQELRACGYKAIEIVPPLFLNGRYEIAPTPGIMEHFEQTGPVWLFVGRLVPNKCQTEIITAFRAFATLHDDAQLVLVGSSGSSITYRQWLENQIRFFGLQSQVHIVGHVSQADLNAYYQVADCFVSMSEHEGFGVPLVESMHFDVPVIAYRAAAVPETLGDAGLLVRQRDPFLVAELAHLMVTDDAAREAVLAGQRRRLAAFALPAVQQRLLQAVQRFF